MIGLESICGIFNSATRCIFDNEASDHKDGDSNYAIKVYQNKKLIEMVYMLDPKGYTRATAEALHRPVGIIECQCRFIEL